MFLLKPIQKMLNSHLKMLKQQHFLYQRKNLYDLMPSRSFSGEPTSDDNSRFHPCWSSFLFSSRRTLYLLVWRWGEGVAELEPGKFLAQRGSASLGVVPTVNKKTQINSRTYSFLSKLTYMLINIDPQPNIKPPERLTYTLKNTTHSRVLKTLERETSAGILRNTQDSIRLCYGFKSALSERKRVMSFLSVFLI